MKLYRGTHANLVDPWGRKHPGYYRVVEVIDDVELNGDTSLVGDGYKEPWNAPHWQSSDGRVWVEIQNRVDCWGGKWYKALFQAPRDPNLDKYHVGLSIMYWDEKQVKTKHLVDDYGKPVDVDGNRLR
jgi:hypothetical protein